MSSNTEPALEHTSIEKQPTKWYRTPFYNATILGMCSFAAPGLWGAMNSLGAGGAQKPYLVNAGNALTFVLMVISCWFTSGLVKYVGIKGALVIGTLGFSVYSAGLYLNNRYGVEWLVLFGAACCGVSAGIFWASEAAIGIAYPEPRNRGRMVAYWLSWTRLGQILGGAINLGLNSDRSEAGKVSYTVYLIFIALQVAGPVVAFFLTPPAKVQRSDGTKVDLSIFDNPWKEFKATSKTFLKREFLLLVLWIGQGVYSEAVFFSYIALWFSVRSRALGSFLSGIVAVVAGNVLGAWLDINRYSIQKRGRWAFAAIMTLQGAWWIWLTVNVTEFRRTGPVYDWSDPGFGKAFGVFVFLVSGFQLNYNFAFFLIGQISMSPQETVRLAALLRATESAWQAVSYGLSSLPIFATVGGAYLNFGLWGLSIYPAWLVIRDLKGSFQSAESEESPEEADASSRFVVSREELQEQIDYPSCIIPIQTRGPIGVMWVQLTSEKSDPSSSAAWLVNRVGSPSLAVTTNYQPAHAARPAGVPIFVFTAPDLSDERRHNCNDRRGSPPATPNASHRYPNPGFLGASSHSAIFNHVSTRSDSELRNQAQESHSPAARIRSDRESIPARDIDTLSQLGQLDIQSLVRLLEAWTVTGASLALAQPFIQCSTVAAMNLCQLLSRNCAQDEHVALARLLITNTRASEFDKHSTIEDFVAYLSVSSNLRWEVLGFFVTAVGRACVEMPSYIALFTPGEQRMQLARTLMSLSDACMDSCISLDTLTDLQLVLQFENAILHSQIDGDQSYHEKIVDESAHVPYFLRELRKACFARIYAGDKELAVFLGRPPRVNGAYCVFQLPEWSSLPWDHYVNRGRHSTHGSGASAAINYTADTRRSALFARLKEEIMQPLRNRQRAHASKTTELRRKIHAEWEALPAHFRLTTSLKECRHRPPFEKDFLVGTRLDYLHTNFLLDLSSQGKVSEPDEVIVSTAAEMLSLVVELVILRDSIVNSGSSLVWKVAHFGLPAAGIVSLALLNTFASLGDTARIKMLQNLTILHAEITIGSWIQAGDANFSLFERATDTIKILLDSKVPWSSAAEQTPQISVVEQWDPYSGLQPWDFEIDFWANLAEHPTLLG
ncbi:Notoamide biosynthesis cluster protein O' [Paramyrothecium foliicola]|nr:Notoamide biosynthesis cluster protein O' [Paramyrothecium foliicola]